jgi:hypothetical protein
MSRKRLSGMLLLVVLAVASALAQTNEMSLTAGLTFESTQTNRLALSEDPQDFNPTIHFGNGKSGVFSYGRLLTIRKGIGLTAEVPAAIDFRTNLNTYLNQIPKDFGALFVTPSLRVNFFARDSLTPWVSAGGGYGRFRYPHELVWGNAPNPYTGPGGTNTGVIQFGAGLDAWVWRKWGFRGEVRDFYSGELDLNGTSALPVDTGRSRLHNYYVGIGVMTHW